MRQLLAAGCWLLALTGLISEVRVNKPFLVLTHLPPVISCLAGGENEKSPLPLVAATFSLASRAPKASKCSSQSAS